MEKPTGLIQKIIESLQQINALDAYSPIEKDIILHNLRAAYTLLLNCPSNVESTISRVDFVEFEEPKPMILPEIIEEEIIEEEIIEEEIKEEEIKEDEIIEPEINENERVEVEWVEEEVINEDVEFLEEKPEYFEDELIESEIVEEEVIEDELIEVEIVEEEVIEDELIEVEIVEEVIEDELIEMKIVEEVIEEEVVEKEVEKLSEVTVKVPQTPVFHDDLFELIPDAKPQINIMFGDDMSITKPEKKSLNDFLTDPKEDNSLGSKYQQSYIPDLTKAIAINEKFTFIRELFRNNGGEFSAAINKLNDCENIDSAFEVMEDMKHYYLWNTTSSSYLSLCDLVRRHFVSN